MSSILIYQHLGLGDHIICHGIIRDYCGRYDRVGLICLPHNRVSIAFMFKDLPNLTLIEGDEAFGRDYISRNASRSGTDKYDEVLVLGYEHLDRVSGVPFEKQFYKIAGVDFSKKWDDFHVERDLERESALFNKIAPQGDYVFVHEDPSRNFSINKKRVPARYPLVIADRTDTDNIFDYCIVIERAKEIHVIDSSFMFLIDCLQYSAPGQKLYIHRYSRENNAWKLPVLKKDWHIFTLENYHRGLMRYLRIQIYRIRYKIIGR